MPKLSDTQAVILSAASQRDDGAVLPLPESLKIKGGALNKVMDSLHNRGLIRVLGGGGGPERVVITSEGMATAPAHIRGEARNIWQMIVVDRPTDYFRPGSLLLLEQLCCTMVLQRVVLAQLAEAPTDQSLIKSAKDYVGIVNQTATKLRLTVQEDVDRRSRKIEEREPPADALLDGWRQPE